MEISELIPVEQVAFNGGYFFGVKVQGRGLSHFLLRLTLRSFLQISEGVQCGGRETSKKACFVKMTISF